MPASLIRHCPSRVIRCHAIDLVRPFSSQHVHCRPLPTLDRIHDDVSNFIITSRTTDPYLNLAVEDHLLRTSDPNTRILFTYVNRPCVVIGRNQNPWLEVNLAALRTDRVPDSGPSLTRGDVRGSVRRGVELVRRRSGGGTVFHDEGNLNYSFIVPNDKTFNRNKHAEMVVRALQSMSWSEEGVTCGNGGKQVPLPPALKAGIRVNERHDIVMPARVDWREDAASAQAPREVKISGSAYKLTRGRALHHGTLLFSSPNLQKIGHFLHSPAAAYISAKGVESVRSPIDNVSFSPDLSVRDRLRTDIENGIASVFQDTYNNTTGSTTTSRTSIAESDILSSNHDARNADIISRAYELKSQEWKYLQTPTFTFTSTFPPHPPSKNNNNTTEAAPQSSTRIHLKVTHGLITDSHISTSADPAIADAQAQQLRAVLQDRKLHEVAVDWGGVFGGGGEIDGRLDADTATAAMVAWLEEMLPGPLPLDS